MYSDGALKELWRATGELEENSLDGEDFLLLYNFVAGRLALYDRCLQVWLSYLPGSCFYQDFQAVFDWGNIDDGSFIPKGVPLSGKKCRERFYEILEKMDISSLNSAKFNKQTFEAVIEILKIGKSAFPGLVIRQPDLDMIIQATLKSILVETISTYARGQGKLNFLEEIWRELKDFANLSLVKNSKLAPRPLTAVYTVETTHGSSIQVLDLFNTTASGAAKLTPSAAVRLNIQTRSMVIRGKLRDFG